MDQQQGDPGEGLTEYEQQREARIAANKRRLEELEARAAAGREAPAGRGTAALPRPQLQPGVGTPPQVPQLAASMTAAARQEKQATKARKEAKVAPPAGGAVRRSSRATAAATRAKLQEAAAAGSGTRPQPPAWLPSLLASRAPCTARPQPHPAHQPTLLLFHAADEDGGGEEPGSSGDEGDGSDGPGPSSGSKRRSADRAYSPDSSDVEVLEDSGDEGPGGGEGAGGPRAGGKWPCERRWARAAAAGSRAVRACQPACLWWLQPSELRACPGADVAAELEDEVAASAGTPAAGAKRGAGRGRGRGKGRGGGAAGRGAAAAAQTAGAAAEGALLLPAVLGLLLGPAAGPAQGPETAPVPAAAALHTHPLLPQGRLPYAPPAFAADDPELQAAIALSLRDAQRPSTPPEGASPAAAAAAAKPARKRASAAGGGGGKRGGRRGSAAAAPTPATEGELVKVFQMFDPAGSGFITKQRLSEQAEALGGWPAARGAVLVLLGLRCLPVAGGLCRRHAPLGHCTGWSTRRAAGRAAAPGRSRAPTRRSPSLPHPRPPCRRRGRQRAAAGGHVCRGGGHLRRGAREHHLVRALPEDTRRGVCQQLMTGRGLGWRCVQWGFWGVGSSQWELAACAAKRSGGKMRGLHRQARVK
jgi:hypothetical protein